MLTINLDWLLVEVAFVVATALLGFLIGWKYTALWTVGVFFATIVASKLGPKLGLLINKLIAVVGQFIALALGRDENSIKTPTVAISDTMLPLATALFFLLLVLVAIWVARKLGNAAAIGLAGKLFGAVFGALGTVLVLSEVSSYYEQFVAKSGNDPLAKALNISIPTVSVGIGGTSGATNWASLGTLAIALFLMLLLLYIVWRVVRTVL